MDPRMPNYPYGSSQDNGHGNIPPQSLYPTPATGQDPYGQAWQQQGQQQWNHYPEWTFEDYSNPASAPVYPQAMQGYPVPMDAQYQHFDPSAMQQQTTAGYQMPSDPLVYNPAMNPQQSAHWSQSSQPSQTIQPQVPLYPNQTAPRTVPVPQRELLTTIKPKGGGNVLTAQQNSIGSETQLDIFDQFIQGSLRGFVVVVEMVSFVVTLVSHTGGVNPIAMPYINNLEMEKTRKEPIWGLYNTQYGVKTTL
ncbi:5874_t:CDS:2, partial [Acaulospora colombiana]